MYYRIKLIKYSHQTAIKQFNYHKKQSLISNLQLVVSSKFDLMPV